MAKTPKKLTKAKQAEFDELIAKANKLYEQKKLAEVIVTLDQAIALNPDDAIAWNVRGFAKYELEQYAEAIKDFDEAIRLDPAYAPALNNRGNAKNRLEQYAEAMKDFDEAIRLNAENATTWHNRGVTKARRKLFDEALSDLRHAMSIDPDNSNIRKSFQSIVQEISVEEIANKNATEYSNVAQKMLISAEHYQSVYIILYVIIVFLLLLLGLLVFYILGFYYDKFIDLSCKKDCASVILPIDNVFPLVSALFLLTFPLGWLIRMLVRVADDMRIMSEDYRRIHIIENRIELFFKGDEHKKKLPELHESFINHMMNRSPVETLLKLRKRHHPKEIRHPIETMLDNGEKAVRHKPSDT